MLLAELEAIIFDRSGRCVDISSPRKEPVFYDTLF